MSSKRVLAIFAHPDDESLVAGGTLRACSENGLETVIISLTRGEKGSITRPNLATRETLGLVRESELRAAGKCLGAKMVECFNYPDGELPWTNTSDIKNLLAERIRYWRPDIIITFGAEGLYWHPDHIAVHELTNAALSFVQNDRFSPLVYYATFPEGHITELVSRLESRNLKLDIWGLDPDAFGAPALTITTRLDVRQYLDAKLDALNCHRTQFAGGNLFNSLPRDLAEEFLGWEFFMRAESTQAENDVLLEIVNK